MISFSGNFTCLAVVFNLKRRLGYHLFHTYIPSALIVVMSWISFWIKPEAIPARITLGRKILLNTFRRLIISFKVWHPSWPSQLKTLSRSRAYLRSPTSKLSMFGWVHVQFSCFSRWWNLRLSTTTWDRWRRNRWRATRTKICKQKMISKASTGRRCRSTTHFATVGKSRCLSIKCRVSSFHSRSSFWTWSTGRPSCKISADWENAFRKSFNFLIRKSVSASRIWM